MDHQQGRSRFILLCPTSLPPRYQVTGCGSDSLYNLEVLMAASIGQLDRHVRGWRLRHWIKKQTSGRARRQAKRYLDNAPVRSTKCYAD